MAGITDAPFRDICRRYGAGYTVAEMVSAKKELQHTRKSRLRSQIGGDPEPRAIQIVGADAQSLAEAAVTNVDRGAQIIDINMGCPAKKVCRKAAGSALLRDEGLVAEILQAVVAAVSVPVTLKIRTGWDREFRNTSRNAYDLSSLPDAHHNNGEVPASDHGLVEKFHQQVALRLFCHPADSDLSDRKSRADPEHHDLPPLHRHRSERAPVQPVQG